MNGGEAYRRGPVVRMRVFLLACAALVCGGTAFSVYVASNVTHYAHPTWESRASGAIHASAQRPDHRLRLRPEVQPIRISYTADKHPHALDSNTELAPTKVSFNHLSPADGLSHADVRAIAQDRQGFMWFGTWLGGLNRYDGYTFKVYKHDDRDDRSLGSDDIWALYVDRAGVLWLATNEGLDRYDEDTDSFVHYRHRENDQISLPSYEARSRSLYEDESGVLWVGSKIGLSRFDRATGSFYTYRRNADDPTSLGSTEVRSICPDTTTGLLWLGTWHEGVSVFNRSTGHFTWYKNKLNDPASLSNNDITHILQDRKGSLWISTVRGLNRFDPKTHTFVRYLHDPTNPTSLSDDYVAMTYEDRAGRFWVATNNGLNLMDRGRGTFTHYFHDSNDSSSLSSNTINWNALYEDASGALWIGMRWTGLDRLAGGTERFTAYRHTSQDRLSLSNDFVTGLAMGSAGELWIGTEAGLDRFDGQTFTHYLADANNPNSLSPGPRGSVVQDSHGAVWTGTYGGGLDRLDGHRVKHFRHDPKNSDSPANNNIASIVPDNVGGLWIGVHGNGVDYFNGRHFTHFPPNTGDPASLQDGYVVPLLLDARGILWMGSESWGLVRLDTHTRKFTTYLIDPNHPGSQAANWTEDAYSDGHSIWVASPTNGLFRFDPETGKFTRHYTEKDGLADNTALGILGDAQGNVWVSTANALSKLDPKTEIFRIYDTSDGLQGNWFYHCHAQSPDGRLFFGGSNGLSAFYPAMLADNPAPPPVVLTEFELFNKPVKIGSRNSLLRQAINVTSNITLRHDESVFGFQFAALNYTSPQKNRYAYKLEGFDRDWQYTDATRRFATYTNLDPGRYTFRVKASNNDGVWNERGVTLYLTIVPPWWKTNWFRALCMATFLVLLWALYQLRARQLAAQFNIRLEERVSERTRIARDLHDTLLQSLQGLVFRFQAARYHLPDRPEEACEALDTALASADQALAEGRSSIQELRSQPLKESNMEQVLLAMGRELASSKNGAPASPPLRVIVEGNRRTKRAMIREEIYRIAHELLRNAYRHANARSIEAELRYSDDAFVLIVRDDGKGIDPKVLKEHGSAGHWGLRGIYERAEGIGAQLDVWSEAGAGTEFRLTVPGAIAYEKSGHGGTFKLFRKTRIYEHRS